MSNPSHYGGKALDLGSGGFQITTVNSASEDFFMGMWVHFDSYGTSKQFGVDIANNYVYFETQSNGAVKIRHITDGGSTSSNTSLDDGNWHHVALSRTGDTLYGFVDGTAVVSDDGGMTFNSGNSVSANSKFNFWGADNNFTSYNIDGQIIDAFIYIGKGVSSYTNPTAPLVGNDGTINHFSGFTDSDAYYISPCVDVTGSSANSLSGFFKEVAGASTGTASNFTPFNTDINTVRGQETGYCTMNPLDQRFTDNGTISNGNLDYSQSSTGGRAARCTIGVSSGKWYWEFTHLGGNNSHGIQKLSNIGAYPGTDNDGISWFVGGNIYRNGSTSTYSGKTYAVGDCIGTALDLDNGTLVYYKNGVSQGVAASGLTGTWFPSFGSSNVSVVSFTSNFGQKPFKFPPPDGFQSLNAANVRPEKVIARPDQYVGVTKYTSNNNTLSVSDYKFQPDLLIFKNRDTANHWGWFDSVRGANKQLSSNRTREEITTSGSGYGTGTMNSFDPFGFTLGDDVGSNVTNYPSGDKHVAYGFKGSGGNKNTFNVDDVGYASASASGITDGTIPLTGCSVGTRQGFSILKYTGSGSNGTLAHGLSQAPDFFFRTRS